MLSWCFVLIGISAMLLGAISLALQEFFDWHHKYSNFFEVLTKIFLGLCIVSMLFGVVEKEIAVRTSSSSYYYDMLEQKTFIEEQMEIHKKEIEVLHTGEVDGVAFKNKNEMINLNNTIERYNFTILRHQEYKDSYWHSERYNEAVANLNTFEKIF